MDFPETDDYSEDDDYMPHSSDTEGAIYPLEEISFDYHLDRRGDAPESPKDDDKRDAYQPCLQQLKRIFEHR